MQPSRTFLELKSSNGTLLVLGKEFVTTFRVYNTAGIGVMTENKVFVIKTVSNEIKIQFQFAKATDSNKETMNSVIKQMLDFLCSDYPTSDLSIDLSKLNPDLILSQEGDRFVVRAIEIGLDIKPETVYI